MLNLSKKINFLEKQKEKFKNDLKKEKFKMILKKKNFLKEE